MPPDGFTTYSTCIRTICHFPLLEPTYKDKCIKLVYMLTLTRQIINELLAISYESFHELNFVLRQNEIVTNDNDKASNYELLLSL